MFCLFQLLTTSIKGSFSCQSKALNLFFFFLLDRWAWGPIHCLAHKKISIYSRDETTCKCHFPGIARLVEKNWHKVKTYCLVGLMCFFLSSACCPSSTSPGNMTMHPLKHFEDSFGEKPNKCNVTMPALIRVR